MGLVGRALRGLHPLNAAGAHISFRFAIVVSIISIAILAGVLGDGAVLRACSAGTALFNIAPDPGQSAFLPHGVLPILFALPFAMWFFLGIEELPLAAEESHDPVRDIPRAGFWARGTLIVTGLLVLFLNTGVIGAEATAVSLEPLLDGFRAIVGDAGAAVLALFALIGLLASLQGIMFAYGRNMYSLSRAGYYPKFFSLTGKRQTPWVALVVGAVIGFIALDRARHPEPGRRGGSRGGRRRHHPEHRGLGSGARLPAADGRRSSFCAGSSRTPSRPYRSPWGIPGAVVAAVIAALIFVGFLLNPAFQPAIVAVGVVYVVILIGFAVYGRKQLVLSPEEEYAMSGGLHRDPQAEGYVAMEEEVFEGRSAEDEKR